MPPVPCGSIMKVCRAPSPSCRVFLDRSANWVIVVTTLAAEDPIECIQADREWDVGLAIARRARFCNPRGPRCSPRQLMPTPHCFVARTHEEVLQSIVRHHVRFVVHFLQLRR